MLLYCMVNNVHNVSSRIRSEQRGRKFACIHLNYTENEAIEGIDEGGEKWHHIMEQNK